MLLHMRQADTELLSKKVVILEEELRRLRDGERQGGQGPAAGSTARSNDPSGNSSVHTSPVHASAPASAAGEATLMFGSDWSDGSTQPPPFRLNVSNDGSKGASAVSSMPQSPAKLPIARRLSHCVTAADAAAMPSGLGRPPFVHNDLRPLAIGFSPSGAGRSLQSEPVSIPGRQTGRYPEGGSRALRARRQVTGDFMSQGSGFTRRGSTGILPSTSEAQSPSKPDWTAALLQATQTIDRILSGKKVGIQSFATSSHTQL